MPTTQRARATDRRTCNAESLLVKPWTTSSISPGRQARVFFCSGRGGVGGTCRSGQIGQRGVCGDEPRRRRGDRCVALAGGAGPACCRSVRGRSEQGGREPVKSDNSRGKGGASAEVLEEEVGRAAARETATGGSTRPSSALGAASSSSMLDGRAGEAGERTVGEQSILPSRSALRCPLVSWAARRPQPARPPPPPPSLERAKGTDIVPVLTLGGRVEEVARVEGRADLEPVVGRHRRRRCRCHAGCSPRHRVADLSLTLSRPRAQPHSRRVLPRSPLYLNQPCRSLPAPPRAPKAQLARPRSPSSTTAVTRTGLTCAYSSSLSLPRGATDASLTPPSPRSQLPSAADRGRHARAI